MWNLRKLGLLCFPVFVTIPRGSYRQANKVDKNGLAAAGIRCLGSSHFYHIKYCDSTNLEENPQGGPTMGILETLKFGLPLLFAICLTAVPILWSNGYKIAAIWTSAAAVVALVLALASHFHLQVLREEQQMQEVEADQDSPLSFSAYIAPGDENYRAGTDIAGIQWNDHYVDVRLSIRNGDATAAQNIDLFVELDTSIAAMGQLSNVPDVNFSTGEMPAAWLEGTDEEGKPVTIPIVPVGDTITPVYRVSCPKLLGGANINLLLVSVALNPPEGAKLPKKLFPPRRKPAWVRLRGTYEMPEGHPPRRYRVVANIPFDRNK